MANVIYYGNLAGVTVNALRGATQASFDSNGIAEVDPTDTNLVTAIEAQGAVCVDVEGAEEALTAGTVQTATTLSGLSIRNGAGASVINVFDTDADGTLVYGPLTLAAGEERLIVFPTQLTVAGGVFVEVVSGALHATPGFLIP